ncbi:hypothetical protein [Paraburkholderia rhizosphaerae]|uniref:Calcineurin-like phosphoesterase family protein n=1 Tax=Paraburkholderia rhizosphaerae TaxID=480658 RepID=A0A4R8LLM2_9BURK|nr:hypothetical protein [Paraburkholderia rhizosphaerae]TDY45066.1 hypothetical protein BX592_11533 [Paraburkholderia rhizosphaerae]
MSWPRPRTRSAERASVAWAATAVAASRAALGSAALVCACWVPGSANAAAAHYAFAVVTSTLQSATDEAPTQRLIDAIGRDTQVAFIVYDGNLKSGSEPCRDSLYETREALLQASKPALVFVPGQHDWADCNTAAAGGFDPVERLDQLRQTLFTDDSSMGQNPLPLARESEVSRFRTYRENVRWQLGDTVFVGLNVPSPNNHYLTAGGRNGEFEDRVIANAFWLDHAAEYAKRRDAKAIVVFVQGDFDPERYERRERFAWLRFEHKPRDGYLEFKRSLVKLAESFRGPVLVIHQDDEPVRGGFMIDQPLRNDKGALVTNLTRIAIAPHNRLTQWVQIDADFALRTPFRVSLHEVPKDMPLPPTLPLPAHNDYTNPLPEPMPLVPQYSPAPDLPPLLPAPQSSPVIPSIPGTNRPAPGATPATPDASPPPDPTQSEGDEAGDGNGHRPGSSASSPSMGTVTP